MGYKLNITKEELGDFIIMVFFDKMFDDSFLKNNENFDELFQELAGMGLKGRIFDKYFDVDPKIRSRYRMFKRSFYDPGKVTINMRNGESEEEE